MVWRQMTVGSLLRGGGLREVLSSRAEDSTLINSPYLAPLIDLRSANVRGTANANFLAATFSHVCALHSSISLT